VITGASPAAIVRAALIGVALCVAGCSKDDDATKMKPARALGARPGAPAPAQPVEPSPDEPTGGSPSTAAAHVAIETTDAAPVTYTVTTRREAGVAAPDPDVAVIEAARESAARCFTGISNGAQSRSASIRVVVLPSGSVNRTEVSAPTTQESWILSCLEGVGSGLRFSEKPKADIRNFTVSVTVTRSTQGH